MIDITPIVDSNVVIFRHIPVNGLQSTTKWYVCIWYVEVCYVTSMQAMGCVFAALQSAMYAHANTCWYSVHTLMSLLSRNGEGVCMCRHVIKLCSHPAAVCGDCGPLKPTLNWFHIQAYRASGCMTLYWSASSSEKLDVGWVQGLESIIWCTLYIYLRTSSYVWSRMKQSFCSLLRACMQWCSGVTIQLGHAA